MGIAEPFSAVNTGTTSNSKTSHAPSSRSATKGVHQPPNHRVMTCLTPSSITTTAYATGQGTRAPASRWSAAVPVPLSVDVFALCARGKTLPSIDRSLYSSHGSRHSNRATLHDIETTQLAFSHT